MSGTLSGKVALVTGGSRGIGAAIVRRLASEGAQVAFSYFASPQKAEELVSGIAASGGRAACFRADQGNIQEVETLVASTYKAFGQLDILVNNAGIGLQGVLGQSDLDDDAVDRLFAVNVRGVTTAVRAAVPIMPDGGRIISIGSFLGVRAPYRGISDYSATKAAVAAYTRGWARDLGPRNITVNVVQPGAIHTDMVPDTGEAASMLAQSAALGRLGQPPAIAGAVAFLAGPDAEYITGATLNVDGGQLT